MDDIVVAKGEGVNWKQVGLFLVLTFGLTWLLDLVLWLTVGYGQNVTTAVLLQLQMLLPAFSANQRRSVSSDHTLPTPAAVSTVACTSAITFSVCGE